MGIVARKTLCIYAFRGNAIGVPSQHASVGTPMKRSLNTLSIRFDTIGRPRALNLPTIRLTAVEGPQKRRSTSLQLGRAVIGSAKGSDFQLDDPTISSIHCEIKADDRGIRITDLESKNGIFIDGRRVWDSWLNAGDVFHLGETAIRVDPAGELVEQPLSDRNGLGALVGESLAMRLLYDELLRAAASDSALLLEGESGVGKELAAEAVVQESARRNQPFEVFDCRSIPSTLFDSELFGYNKGAFTGATEDHPGVFERAHQGTLLLDGIGELPLELQPKLLRVLDQQEVQRLGSSTRRRVNVRVIATTDRRLEHEVNRGTFRTDLYYRLAVIRVRVPPLREHPEDIPALVTLLLKQFNGPPTLPNSVLDEFCRGAWPGNVRELRSAVQRFVLGLSVRPPSSVNSNVHLDPEQPFWPQRDVLIGGIEREYLIRLIETEEGNLSEVSRRSGISRAHLYSMLRQHGLRRGP